MLPCLVVCFMFLNMGSGDLTQVLIPSYIQDKDFITKISPQTFYGLGIALSLRTPGPSVASAWDPSAGIMNVCFAYPVKI